MNVKYVDAHCHLQFEQYKHDREAIVARMREESIAGIVVGTDLESSRKALELAEQHEHLFASIGVHPTDTEEPFDAEAFRALAASERVVAIGECGLDYFRTDNIALAREKQVPLFKQQIKLAGELGLPLVTHARPSKGTMDAYRDVLDILKEAKKKYPDLCGDSHFFAGGLPEAEAFVGLGFSISFTAVITFVRDYDEVIRAVPLANILAETDAPYVAPASRRGERNDPLAVIEVVAKLANIRGEDPESVRIALLANARRLFTAF